MSTFSGVKRLWRRCGSPFLVSGAIGAGPSEGIGFSNSMPATCAVRPLDSTVVDQRTTAFDITRAFWLGKMMPTMTGIPSRRRPFVTMQAPVELVSSSRTARL